MELTTWHNPPSDWHRTKGKIWAKTSLKTDFWRTTHYGFIRDSGHFFYGEVSGDFVATVCITGQYETLYDQAGLMIRADERHWVKCGIEFVDGVQYASAVVTRELSDWSVAPVGQPERLWMRLRRTKETVEVLYSVDGSAFSMLRLANFPEEPTLAVGLMCASPEREGFEVTFDQFSVELQTAN